MGTLPWNKKAPKEPADGLKFTDNDGKLIVPDAKEHEAVTKRGCRKLVSTLLWMASTEWLPYYKLCSGSTLQSHEKAVREGVGIVSALPALPL